MIIGLTSRWKPCLHFETNHFTGNATVPSLIHIIDLTPCRGCRDRDIQSHRDWHVTVSGLLLAGTESVCSGFK